MAKPHVPTTITPLHFEDLEPHRFEDLVRQLAHGFRDWSRLEATGRLGADEGIDIRGIEAAPYPGEGLPGDEDEEEEDVEPAPAVEEREWRIQCKRYRVINPKLMRSIVAEAVPDVANPPYGLIIAAACDVSAKAMAAFHEERIKRGVAEGHLWVRAHLEDMLFMPRNDHLLFAYFGISLGTRRRRELQQIRAVLATKRKVMRAFELKDIRSLSFEDVIIRDVSDASYPRVHEFGAKHIFKVAPWIIGAVVQAYEFGLVVSRYDFDGWVKEDGSWDILRDSASLSSVLRFSVFDRILYGDRETDLNKRLRAIYQELVPESERAEIRMAFLLPFESILEVDPIGDILFEATHLFCSYSGELGPFKDIHFYSSDKYEARFLSVEKHAPLFTELFSTHLTGDELRDVNFLVKSN